MAAQLRIKINRQRQARFPSKTLKALGVKPGDYLVLSKDGIDWKIRSKMIDLSKLAPLQNKVPENFKPFDLQKWRDQPKDYVHLRD
jgi:bifunctional DNA-binding transcriptional regulator/antitoxin component of YhaV-PrlF toxin-antitoxin module